MSARRRKTALGIATTLALLAYPLLVYAFLDRVAPVLLVASLGLLGAARIAAATSLRKWQRLLLLLLLGLFCSAAWLGSRWELVKLYPVVINASGATWFAWTLIHPPSAAERLARAGSPREQFDERKSFYTRRVTQVWVVFFLLNGAAATYTALATSTAAWAAYNGLISYLLIGLLLGGEYVFRIRYRRRHIGGMDRCRDVTIS